MGYSQTTTAEIVERGFVDGSDIFGAVATEYNTTTSMITANGTWLASIALPSTIRVQIELAHSHSGVGSRFRLLVDGVSKWTVLSTAAGWTLYQGTVTVDWGRGALIQGQLIAEAPVTAYCRNFRILGMETPLTLAGV